MTVGKTRKMHVRLPQEKRMTDLMAAARQLISEKGYENLVMSEVAARAGVVEGTLYRYFGTKKDLLTLVAEDWFEEVLEGYVKIPDEIKGTKNRLRFMIRRALVGIRREPALTRYMLLEVRRELDYRNTRSFELNKRMTEEIAKLCADAVASGEFKDDISVPLMRDMIFGCIEHRTWRFLRGEGDFSVDEVADGIATMVCRGMTTESPAHKSDIESVVQRLEKVASTMELSTSQNAAPTARPPKRR